MNMAYYTGESLQVSKSISKLINADNEILHSRCQVCDAKSKSNSAMNFKASNAGSLKLNATLHTGKLCFLNIFPQQAFLFEPEVLSRENVHLFSYTSSN